MSIAVLSSPSSSRSSSLRTAVVDADRADIELCAIAERCPVSQLLVELAKWRNERESDDERDKRQRSATTLRWGLDADGMISGWFRDPPEIAAMLTGTVDARVARALRGQHAPAGDRSSRSVSKWPSLGQQRADADIPRCDKTCRPRTRPRLRRLRVDDLDPLRPQPRLRTNPPHRHRRTRTPLPTLPPQTPRGAAVAEMKGTRARAT